MPRTLEKIQKDTLKEQEEKAYAMRNSRTALRKQLMEAKAVLKTQYNKRFKKNIFDFDNARLVSDDGKLALQWRLRENPNSPPSYNNQQTTVGIIFLKTI